MQACRLRSITAAVTASLGRPAGFGQPHCLPCACSGWDSSKEVLAEALVHAAEPKLALVSAKQLQQAPGKLPPKFVQRPSYRELRQLEFVSQVCPACAARTGSTVEITRSFLQAVGVVGVAVMPHSVASSCHRPMFSTNNLCVVNWLQIDVSAIDEASSCTMRPDTKRYWAGAWWHTSLSFYADNANIGAFLSCSLPCGATCPASGLVGAAAVGPIVDFSIAVAHYASGGAREGWDSQLSGFNSTFRPLSQAHVSAKRGWACFNFEGTCGGEPITRANFKAAESLLVKDGKVAVKATIRLKTEAACLHCDTD